MTVPKHPLPLLTEVLQAGPAAGESTAQAPAAVPPPAGSNQTRHSGPGASLSADQLDALAAELASALQPQLQNLIRAALASSALGQDRP